MASDPYKYFRIEAREIVDDLARSLLDLARGEGGGDALDRCFRSAHTLKGAARVVRQLEIGELAHAIEDVLTPYRAGGGALPADHARDLLRLVDQIRDGVAAIDAPSSEGASPREPGAGPSAGTPRDERRFETARVQLDDLDALAEEAVEAEALLPTLRGGLAALAEAERFAARITGEVESHKGDPSEAWDRRMRKLFDELREELQHARTTLVRGVDRLEGELRQVQVRARALRLVHASEILAPVEIAAHEAAAELGKLLDLEVAVGDVRLDGHMLAALRDALIHVVRNAVDHGIDDPDKRVAAGKPPAGKVRLRVERRGSRAAFICSDDGPGVDLAAVRRAAERAGLSGGARAENDEALSWIFRAGVSTREAVTRLSGRGVGLDVVRETAARLKGHARVDSVPGRGTTIEIVVPVSLSSVLGLRVESGGVAALIPLDAAIAAIQLPEGAVLRGTERDVVLHDERLVPFAPLLEILGARAAAPRASRAAVIVEIAGRRAAIGVEHLLDPADVVVRPLPAAAGASAVVIGATFDVLGDPVLVLHPEGLIDAIYAARPGESIAPPKRSAPVLIIDDSLTTRMLEQSILEAEGHEIEVAASGEEGLKKAAERRYGLFIVDVEMPGMNGFEFVRRVRADPALQGTPAILVTSLSSAEDRRRGLEAGADGYIVKGEFDQRQLLRTVGSLLARREGGGS